MFEFVFNFPVTCTKYTLTYFLCWMSGLRKKSLVSEIHCYKKKLVTVSHQSWKAARKQIFSKKKENICFYEPQNKALLLFCTHGGCMSIFLVHGFPLFPLIVL